MNDEQRRIYTYLKAHIQAGQRYFRARHMAKDLEMTPHCVGTNLKRLSVFCKDLTITRWARSVSVTWYITPA